MTKKMAAVRELAAVHPVRRPRPVRVEPRYGDRREGAEYLAIGVEKFVEHVRAGEIPEIDLGPSCKRYAFADLDAFAAKKRRIKK